MKRTVLVLVMVGMMAVNAQGAIATIYQADQVWLMSADSYKATTGGDTGYYYGDTMGLVKYDLSALAAPAGYTTVVNSAVMSLWTNAIHQGEFSDGLYAASDGWSFATVSWANRPTKGSLITSWSYPGHNANANLNVASFIQAEANGDKVATVWIEDIDATGTDYHYYYTYPGAWCEAIIDVNYDFVPVPEPVTMVLLGLGSLLGLVRRSK